MTTLYVHPGLLADIIAHPGDDTPRMMYADWFDEQGHPDRAEFIRVQCRIAVMDEAGEGAIDSEEGHTCVLDPCPVCVKVDEYEALLRRESQLLEAHRAEWFRLLGRVPGFGENEPLRWWPVASNEGERQDRGPDCPSLSAAIEATPRRGFVDKITLAWSDFLAHSCALTSTHPITRVQLTTWPLLLMFGGPEREERMLLVQNYEYQLAGVWKMPLDRAAKPWAEIPGSSQPELVATLLRRAWDRLDFELPPIDDWTPLEGDFIDQVARVPAHIFRGRPT